MMAQNKGAGRDDRVIKGFKAGIILEIIYGIFIFFVCFVFAGPLMKLFTSDTEVIRHGVIYLKLISVMYILPALTNGIQGYFRGIGDLKITLLSSISLVRGLLLSHLLNIFLSHKQRTNTYKYQAYCTARH